MLDSKITVAATTTLPVVTLTYFGIDRINYSDLYVSIQIIMIAFLGSLIAIMHDIYKNGFKVSFKSFFHYLFLIFSGVFCSYFSTPIITDLIVKYTDINNDNYKISYFVCAILGMNGKQAVVLVQRIPLLLNNKLFRTEESSDKNVNITINNKDTSNNKDTRRKK